MNVLIIEDEALAAKRLSNFLHRYDPTILIADILESVEDAVKWFSQNKADLIFLDVHLSDANSLQLFEQIKIEQPIIFITAYQQYALKAFKVNAIDYLLKPYSYEELEAAINKAKKYFLDKNIALQPVKTGKRFTFSDVESDANISVEENQIAYLRSEGRYTYVVLFNEKVLKTLQSTTELEESLNPVNFFRINRAIILNYSSIEKFSIASRSRLSFTLKIACPYPLISSTAKTPELKKWLSK
ncbi:MAG: LytR/AlgR family response regulator transcription factor [Luteibaculaceae bacterium]